MIWEYIGECGSTEHDQMEYCFAECYVLRNFLIATVGEPPEGSVLETRIIRHELGPYPEVKLGWEQWDERSEFWEADSEPS
mgnify:CR=1 FL=1